MKTALLYSAMTVAVAVNSACCDNKSDNASERGLSSMHSSKSLDAGHEERLAPAHSFQSEVGGQGIDMPVVPGGVSGLISPSYDLRASYSP